MLILFKRSGREVISSRIKRRRIFTVLTLLFLIIFSALFVTSKYYNTKTKAAATFTADEMILGPNDVMYIGAQGYTSQRFYSDIGMPANSTPEFNLGSSTLPAGHNHVFNNTNVTTLSQSLCPTRRDGSSAPFETCAYIVGDGTGMIIRFNQKIQIDGQLYIGDRVVLEAPEIIIGDTGKIYANGQDGSLGYGDLCGPGGIGGSIGGSSQYGAPELIPTHSANDGLGHTLLYCSPGVAGAEGRQIIGSLFADVASQFTIDGIAAIGGAAGYNSGPLNGSPGVTYTGVTSAVGVGGGGPSGPTGSTSGEGEAGGDHGSSGGGGGGFGVVLKASNSLTVSTSSVITAKGGNSPVSDETAAARGGSPQYPGHSQLASGGYGGPGGGGVIIVDSGNIHFTIGGQTAMPNYTIFNVMPGIFNNVSELDTHKFPGTASAGTFAIRQAGFSKISKQVSPLNVNPGGQVTVTLTIPVSQGGTFNVEDEVLNDGNGASAKYFAVDASTLPAGCSIAENGHKISCPNYSQSPIIYKLIAPRD
jgi:hypothetical protein